MDYPTTVAPIAAGELESALRPFGQGTMLPAVAYTSTEILGIKMPFPIFVAPTASQGPLHPQGE